MKSNNLSKILKTSGFKDVKLDSIIESRYILKRSGGNFKQYLFSFYDQNYKDFSLIPDLSIASVIKFIQIKNKKKIKWSYSGEAYRKQNKNNKSPIIKQTGFEIFGSNTKAKDDNEIIITSLKIFKKSNFKNCELNISNIEIFHTLVNKLSLPLRWKEKIKRHFSREIYFNQLLKKLSDNTDINPKVVENDKALAEKFRKKDLSKNYSGRSLKDILERFDLKNYQDPRNLSNKKSVKIIKDYLKITCPIEKAPRYLNNFFKKNNLNIFISSDYFPIKKNNIKDTRVYFSTNINRSVSYYTGMTFNIQVKVNKKKLIFLSGGRFDNLIKNLGNKTDLPAVGAAINRSIL